MRSKECVTLKIETKYVGSGPYSVAAEVVGLFKENPKSGLNVLNESSRDRVKKVVDNGDFKGNYKQVSVVYSFDEPTSERVILVGLGKKNEFTLERARQAAAVGAKKVRSLGLTSFGLHLLGKEKRGISPKDLAQAMVEGSELALYKFDQYKSRKDDDEENSDKELQNCTLLFTKPGDRVAVKSGSASGSIYAEVTAIARDFGNTPSNDLPPAELARRAQKLARKYGFSCKVLDEKQIAKEGMGGLTAVGQGSIHPPRFIILDYVPKRTHAKSNTLVFVGKGITFDTGGISIKPSAKMDEMKFDMCGAAAVVSAVCGIAALRIPVHVVGLIPTAENMPSGNAIKPGDVIKMYSGTTVEIKNTDAEGRLILGDALAYAENFDPKGVVDLATLTGACVIALGSHAAGMLGSSDYLKRCLKEAGETAGDRVWELPLWPEYAKQIRSDVADIQNLGGREGGTITAASFLHKFAKNYPWGHLDIAGTAWHTKTLSSYIPRGGTGFGTRLLIELTQGFSKGKFKFNKLK